MPIIVINAYLPNEIPRLRLVMPINTQPMIPLRYASSKKSVNNIIKYSIPITVTSYKLSSLFVDLSWYGLINPFNANMIIA
jgi:hypothetical protein